MFSPGTQSIAAPDYRINNIENPVVNAAIDLIFNYSSSYSFNRIRLGTSDYSFNYNVNNLDPSIVLSPVHDFDFNYNYSNIDYNLILSPLIDYSVSYSISDLDVGPVFTGKLSILSFFDNMFSSTNILNSSVSLPSSFSNNWDYTRARSVVSSVQFNYTTNIKNTAIISDSSSINISFDDTFKYNLLRLGTFDLNTNFNQTSKSSIIHQLDPTTLSILFSKNIEGLVVRLSSADYLVNFDSSYSFSVGFSPLVNLLIKYTVNYKSSITFQGESTYLSSFTYSNAQPSLVSSPTINTLFKWSTDFDSIRLLLSSVSMSFNYSVVDLSPEIILVSNVTVATNFSQVSNINFISGRLENEYSVSYDLSLDYSLISSSFLLFTTSIKFDKLLTRRAIFSSIGLSVVSNLLIVFSTSFKDLSIPTTYIQECILQKFVTQVNNTTKIQESEEKSTGIQATVHKKTITR